MRTPLHSVHNRLAAKMIEFAGWEMPLYYTSIIREVKAVRNTAGIFDLSHMGELLVSGPGALELVQYVTTNDASRLGVGQAQYTLMCDIDGGIIDDLVLYRPRGDTYLLVVNASNTESDFKHIKRLARHNAHCEDRSQEIALVAIQGPFSSRILQPISESDISTLPKFGVRTDRVGDISCWVARTGYTGEDGFEIYCPANESRRLWQAVFASGEKNNAEPAGLGARDVLRLEAGYPLYGNELTNSVNPIEARLIWVVKLEKGDFIGRDAIYRKMNATPEKLLVGLEAIERCVPRHDYDVTTDDKVVGHVTSGTFSPTIEKGIALAYVDPSYSAEGIRLLVRIRQHSCACQVVKLPFYRSKYQAKAAA